MSHEHALGLQDRLYPRPEQEKRLNRSLLLLCQLYNDLKAEEMRRYTEDHKSTSLTRFRGLALGARGLNKDLQTIHSQAVQNVGDRIHRSFRNFFKGRARFPRWKKPIRYNSLTYPQSGFKLSLRKGLYLSGVGDVRILVHRPLLGNVKRVTIKREADGWYASFITEREAPQSKPLPEIPPARVRGADVGLTKFATFDDGSSVKYPQFLGQSEGKTKRLQLTSQRSWRVPGAVTNSSGGSQGSIFTSSASGRTSLTSWSMGYSPKATF